MLRRPYVLPLPSLMVRVRQFTIPPPTQASPIQIFARCLARRLSINGELYVGGVPHYSRTVRGKATVGSCWPAVTPPPHQ